MKDYLIENLMGMCRYDCRQKARADYCTACEAAERLKAADMALVRLLEALTGGAAKTWDDVFDAAEAAEVLIDAAATEPERARIPNAPLSDREDNDEDGSIW